jgi:prephenate dehydrogenase
MMLGELLSNADNVLASIAQFRRSLDVIEAALKTNDSAGLGSTLDISRTNYQSLVSSLQ